MMTSKKIIGKITINQNISFVIPKNNNKIKEIKILGSDLHTAMDGDIVSIRKLKKKNDNIFGKVDKILERNLQKLCGIVVLNREKLKRCSIKNKDNIYDVYLPRQNEIMEVKSNINLNKGDIILIKDYKWNNFYSNTEMEKNGIFNEYLGNMLEDQS